MRSFALLVITLVFTLSGCEKIAVMTTPKKQPVRSNNPLAKKAERSFWNTLHAGDYDGISKVNYLLMAAYLKNPNDPQLAAHLGFIHIWKITERERLDSESPLIANEIILSKKYFADALELDPANPIYQGFYGDTQLIEAKIFNDKKEEVQGYFTLKRAIANWPEFNYFTAGYPMSTLSPDSDQFKEGLAWQWKTLDLCAGKRINRNNPDFSAYMKLKTHKGRKRACWNSWIAPYNFEGFFMNMGDMLVKAGEWQTAIKVYKNAKLDEKYASWPYRDMLEQRIVNAKVNVQHFQTNNHHDPDKSILFNSGYGCVACHQR